MLCHRCAFVLVQRLSVAAQAGFPLGLCLVLLNGQPLHVALLVRPAALEWHDVVNLVARAGATALAIGRAGRVPLELVEGRFAALVRLHWPGTHD